MSKYLVEIDGSITLEQIGRAIAGEEVTGSEFLKSVVSFHDGRITNLSEFNDLPAGTRPAAELLLIKQGDKPPDGKIIIWAGIMVVAGMNTAVQAAR